MKRTERTKNNHYVPCMSLKRFESRLGWILRYDLLVPNAKCPIWVKKPLDRVASVSDLYTHLEDGVEVDTHEKWLNKEYETPAEDAVDRAVTGGAMTKEHWRRLVRFLAAQHVRTPARLHNQLARWRKEGPEQIDTLLKECIDEYTTAKREGRPPIKTSNRVEPNFPMRVLITPSSESGKAEIRVETLAGRIRWLWGQRHLLNGIAEQLHDHQWTILAAPDCVHWPATDNPVVCLNEYNNGTYDFNGGWGSLGTAIFMPLDPTHLLYTKIGQKRPQRGVQLERQAGITFRRFVIEHAFRHIFSPIEDPTIPQLRPRHVDVEAYQHEKNEWAKWAEDQANAELDLRRPLAGG